MKKIINGKLYDTATAKLVAEWKHPCGPRDFRYYTEELHRKKTGEYFLYGQGGPASPYARQTGYSEYDEGEDIRPITYFEAQKWAEEKLDADEYEAIFGLIPEDDSTTVICVSLPASSATLLRRKADEAGLSIGDYIASLIK